jgi:hypothetical protein
LHPSRARRDGLQRGHHVRRSPRSREEAPLISAPIVVCARTSLAVTTRAAPCVHATARATSCGELDGSAHERRETFAQHAPPVGGDLGVGAQGDGGRCLRSLQASPPKVPTLKAVEGAKVPAMPAGTRVKSARADCRAASASLRLHRTNRSSAWRTDRYVASDAVASTTGAINSIAQSSRRTRRSRWARTPGHPARDVFTGGLRQGRPALTSPP